jgi:hypothetical protein
LGELEHTGRDVAGKRIWLKIDTMRQEKIRFDVAKPQHGNSKRYLLEVVAS